MHKDISIRILYSYVDLFHNFDSFTLNNMESNKNMGFCFQSIHDKRMRTHIDTNIK